MHCGDKSRYLLKHADLSSRPWFLSHLVSIFHSTGISIPILLADNRTRSSSSMSMPGLYLAISAPYIRCALRYAMNCSASCRRARVYCSEMLLEGGEEKCLRMLERREEGAVVGIRGGSSRRTER